MVLDNQTKLIPHAGHKDYLQWFTILAIHWTSLHINIWDIVDYFFRINYYKYNYLIKVWMF